MQSIKTSKTGRAAVTSVVGMAAAFGVSVAHVRAQTHVGDDAYNGLHWSVSAPQGAAWALECRFRPVTVWINRYERGRWMNVMNQTGRGNARGRLPGDNGRCSLTKTGGVGAVGIALVKDGAATAAGTRDPATPARINVF